VQPYPITVIISPAVGLRKSKSVGVAMLASTGFWRRPSATSGSLQGILLERYYMEMAWEQRKAA
jgi:hypothetical protein